MVREVIRSLGQWWGGGADYYWIQADHYWIQTAHYWIQDAHYWIQADHYWIQASPTTGSRMPPLPDPGSTLLDPGCLYSSPWIHGDTWGYMVVPRCKGIRGTQQPLDTWGYMAVPGCNGIQGTQQPLIPTSECSEGVHGSPCYLPLSAPSPWPWVCPRAWVAPATYL